MIKKLSIYIAEGLDPYSNMAVEKYLTLHAAPDECLLYLWQNERTVFIGRNQNCWSECHVCQLEADGGHLARRLSGGGAVYHDKGNLNFTFACHRDNYNVARQCAVVAGAVQSFGIDAEVSGRNDILAGGAKFSGNAFWRFGENHYHHGTILISADTASMARYLNVPADKLAAKGVASVRSRVVNLTELEPSVDAEKMKEALCSAFGEIYGLQVDRCALPRGATDELAELYTEFNSPDWKYGRTPEFSHKLSGRFAWGGVTLCLDVREGRVADCEVWSDALDADYISSIPHCLCGLRYDATELGLALAADSGRVEATDIARLIEKELL